MPKTNKSLSKSLLQDQRLELGYCRLRRCLIRVRASCVFSRLFARFCEIDGGKESAVHGISLSGSSTSVKDSSVPAGTTARVSKNGAATKVSLVLPEAS
jgi:hypothetical protein